MHFNLYGTLLLVTFYRSNHLMNMDFFGVTHKKNTVILGFTLQILEKKNKCFKRG